MSETTSRIVKSTANSVLRGFDRRQFVRAREEAGLTVQDLGRKAGVDRTAIHRWESGECLPLVDSLSLAAAALQAPLEQLLIIPEHQRTMADLRVLAGLTQAQLSARTGISRRVLGNLERGRGSLGVQRITALAEALRVSEAVIRESYERSAGLK
jgi:transcriptional regulator with XRE-family HTH domain